VISQSLNDKITRTGIDSPAGAVVNLMGEKLALVKGDDGGLALATRKNATDDLAIEYPRSDSIQLDAATPVYPAVIRGGIVFAYLGHSEPPDFPNFDCFRAPTSHTFAFKGLWSCNWLQALEIGIDPAHASFMTQILREYPRPDIDVEETEYGLKITALRHLLNEQTHVRVTKFQRPGKQGINEGTTIKRTSSTKLCAAQKQGKRLSI